MIVFLVSCAVLASVANGGISNDCLRCICKVESSGCRAIGCNWDVNSVSCGYFQIKKDYWIDCGRPWRSWKECANDYNCAAGCVRSYMDRYGGSRGCNGNCESYARLHNGGPSGCRKSSTKTYWNDVKREGCTVNS
ncbi:lysozyme-like [Saccostrea cucullata]|uniref:lysozyme-like n=1 Tax=Saccostrea cuccullata TaxID=36930 RepID=UPI002ED5E677